MLKSEYLRIRAEEREQGIWHWEDVVALRGKSRVLLVFAPSPARLPYKKTMDELWEAGESLENLQTVVVLHSGRPPKDFPHLTPKEGQSARHKFRVAAGEFAIVLLGADLIERRRWTDAITAEDLA